MQLERHTRKHPTSGRQCEMHYEMRRMHNEMPPGEMSAQTHFGHSEYSAKIVPQTQITNIKARYLRFSRKFEGIWAIFLVTSSISAGLNPRYSSTSPTFHPFFSNFYFFNLSISQLSFVPFPTEFPTEEILRILFQKSSSASGQTQPFQKSI